MNPLVRCRQMAGVGAGVGADVGTGVADGVGAGVVGPSAVAGESAGVGAGEYARVGLGSVLASAHTDMAPGHSSHHIFSLV